MPLPGGTTRMPEKACLGPLEEGVTLAVALELDFHVLAQRVDRVVHVDDDGVIDDEIHRHQRLDARRVELLALRLGAHRGEVVQRGKAGHVLQHDAREHEWHFRRARLVRLPGGELAHGLFGDALAVAVAQYRFKHYAQADGHPRRLPEPGFFEGGERIVFAGLAGLELEFLQCVKRVVCHGRCHPIKVMLAIDCQMP